MPQNIGGILFESSSDFTAKPQLNAPAFISSMSIAQSIKIPISCRTSAGLRRSRSLSLGRPHRVLDRPQTGCVVYCGTLARRRNTAAACPMDSPISSLSSKRGARLFAPDDRRVRSLPVSRSKASLFVRPRTGGDRIRNLRNHIKRD